MFDWREVAQNRSAWQSVVKLSVDDLNIDAEKKDDKKKDEKMRSQQVKLSTASAALTCNHPGCKCVAVNHSGLVNHKRQRHKAINYTSCKHCGKTLRSQGLFIYECLGASRY